MQKLNQFLLRVEEKISLAIVAFLGAGLMLFIVSIYCKPGFDPLYHGEVFSRMSTKPFDFSQQFALQNRILAPLLGYLLFLRAASFVWLPLLFLVLLLGLIYVMLRNSQLSPILSWLIVAAFSFSNLIFIPLLSPGYTDPVTYFFVLLSFYWISVSMPLAILSLALAFLNHEQSIFLLPALGFLFLTKDKGFHPKLLWLGTALIPVISYRAWVAAEISPEYSLDFYLSDANLEQCRAVWSKIPLGILYSFKLLWLFPILAGYLFIQQKNKWLLLVLLSGLIFPLAQYLIAYDVSRMYLISFPLFLLAAIQLHQKWGEQKLVVLTVVILFINFLLPQAFMAQEGLFYLHSFGR